MGRLSAKTFIDQLFQICIYVAEVCFQQGEALVGSFSEHFVNIKLMYQLKNYTNECVFLTSSHKPIVPSPQPGVLATKCFKYLTAA